MEVRPTCANNDVIGPDVDDINLNFRASPISFLEIISSNDFFSNSPIRPQEVQ